MAVLGKRSVRIVGAASLLLAMGVCSQAGAVAKKPQLVQDRIAWVHVGDPGNPPDTVQMVSDRTSGYGSVPYSYDIGKYDITNPEYAAFLNAKASKGDPHLLYYPCMSRASCYGLGSGIIRTGSAGNYRYVVEKGRERRPVNYLNLYMALRFANWVNNGEGDASTETGAYTLLGGQIVPTNALSLKRNPGAKVFLTSEDEWYKAAYYSPKLRKYFAYPAGSDQPMECTMPSKARNAGNCDLVTAVNNPDNPGLPSTSAWFYGDITDVGAYPNSVSPYGTYDQGGNVFQWTDVVTTALTNQYQAGSHLQPVLDAVGALIGNPYTEGFGPCAVVRGTDFGDAGAYNSSDNRSCDFSVDPFETYGMRLARLAR